MLIDLIRAFGPPFLSITTFMAFAIIIQSTLRKIDERVDWLAWESVEETMDLVEHHGLPITILRAKMKRTREFLKDRPSAMMLDQFIAAKFA